MQVKTITTVAGVNEIDFGNDCSQSTAHFYWLKNLGDSTLYVSANPNPIAEKDNVAELPAKGAVSVETDEGKIYVLGAGKVEIHRTNSKFCPFDWQASGSGGGGGGSITVDSELSDTSTNPLQNKVTTAAINEVNSTIETLRDDISANTAALKTKSDINHIHDISASGDPVVMDNLQGGVPFSEMVVSGKNLIIPKSVSRSVNGIEFTVNADKSITINGTSTSGTSFMIGSAVLNKNEKYTLSILSESKGINIHIGSGDDFSNPYDYTSTAKTITANSEDNTIWIWISANKTFDNVIIYPQLELGSTATEYEPPITGRELQVNVSGKNLLTLSKSTLTANGITATANDDGSITLSGTATANTCIGMWNNLYARSIGVGKITINAIDGQSIPTYFMGIDRREGSSHIDRIAQSITNNGIGEITQEDVENDRNFYVWVRVAEGCTCNNLIIYPQLELGDTATEYEPYHGSTTIITPTSNPYAIPDSIRQQDGYNVISVSEGELSVVGVQKNAAIKRIWDDMSMDLLFDGVTSADNPAVIDLANYKFVEIHHIMITNEKTYPSNIRLSLDSYLSSTSTIITPIHGSSINTNHTEEGTVSSVYAISAAGSNMNNTKIYGIK